MRHIRIVVAASCVVFFCSATPPLVRTALAQSVPNPVVTGPILPSAAPGDPSKDYPFFSTAFDLAGRGYVEEEYFFGGTASRFNIPVPLTDANTPQTTATVIQTDVPYRTRMIVRRPVSALNFSGTVVMEWQNLASRSCGWAYTGPWALKHSAQHGMAH
jgi:hypothetical protein